MTAPDHRLDVRAAYDVVADDYAALLPGLDAETGLDVAMLDDFADRCAGARLGPVLDAGCGTGRVAAHLASRGLDVVGVDASPRMVDNARRAHPHVRFDVGELEGLPFDDATAGGVLAWYSLIHTAPGRLREVVGELARVSAPGSWLLTAFQSGTGQRVDRANAYGHAVAMTAYRHDPRYVVDVLTAGGFDVHVELHRSAEGPETTPQSIVLARRTG